MSREPLRKKEFPNNKTFYSAFFEKHPASGKKKNRSGPILIGLGRISGNAGLSGRIFHFAGYPACRIIRPAVAGYPAGFWMKNRTIFQALKWHLLPQTIKHVNRRPKITNKKELEPLLNVSIFIDSIRPLLVVRSSSLDFFYNYFRCQ